MNSVHNGRLGQRKVMKANAHATQEHCETSQVAFHNAPGLVPLSYHVNSEQMPPRGDRNVIEQEEGASRKPFVQGYFFLNKWSAGLCSTRMDL